MYAYEYTCTHSEMKVTTNIISTAKPSMWMPKRTRAAPLLNQVNRSRSRKGRTLSVPSPTGERWIHAMAVRTARTNETPTAGMPTSEPPRGIRLPSSRITGNASVGMSGTIHALRRNQVIGGSSALHQIDVVEVDRVTVAVDEEHDGQTHSDFGRGYRDDEQSEDLACQVVAEGAAGDQGDIDVIEDELDRHEHQHRVLAGEGAVHTHAEQERSQEQIFVEEHP